jgi:hypothetical protein
MLVWDLLRNALQVPGGPLHGLLVDRHGQGLDADVVDVMRLVKYLQWQCSVSTVAVQCQYSVSTVSVQCQYCVSTVSVVCQYSVRTVSGQCRYVSTVPVQ